MTPKKHKPEQPDAQIVQGHVLDVLAGMEAESVSCVVTSPPYWSQRKYEAEDVVWGGDARCEHEWSESTHEAHPGQVPDGKYKAASVAEAQRTQISATCSRCGAWRGQLGLEPTVELYVKHTVEWLRAVRRVLRPDGVCWVNLGDGYASNPAKGGSGAGGKEETWCGGAYDRRSRGGLGTLKEKDLILMPSRVALAVQADGWYVRSVVIWNKPNCMPESCKDRPTMSHEYILMLTKNATYWYDSEAVREASITGDTRAPYRSGGAWELDGRSDEQKHGGEHGRLTGTGRNLRSVWTFPTAQTREGTNYAVFPEELPRRCILASCPPDGTVLDPFVGVGTTGVVAQRLGRRFVGIELSQKYCRMAAKRMEQTTLGIPL